VNSEGQGQKQKDDDNLPEYQLMEERFERVVKELREAEKFSVAAAYSSSSAEACG
jgi:hypothetical protein